MDVGNSNLEWTNHKEQFQTPKQDRVRQEEVKETLL